jgi:hypothetical protein
LIIPTADGAHVHRKLGGGVDAYLALLLLAEVRGRMPDEQAEKRVGAALAKVVAKMVRNQRDDGTWPHEGLAPGMALGFANFALNRAYQVGANVDEAVLHKGAERAFTLFTRCLDTWKNGDPFSIPNSGSALTGDGLAVSDPFNAIAGYLITFEASAGTTRQAERSGGPSKRRLAALVKTHGPVVETLINKLEHRGFIELHPLIGGDEYLAYLLIAEGLRGRDSRYLPTWNRRTTTAIQRLQDRDGSWTGGHCLCSRTFCTATVLNILLADPANRERPPERDALRQPGTGALF